MRFRTWPHLLGAAATLWAVLPGSAQAPRPASVPVRSYIGSGPTGEADLAKLKAALEKLGGVDGVELRPRPGGLTIVIRGETGGTLLTAAARSAGFSLRPPATRTYVATGSSAAEALARLRAAVEKVADVERAEVGLAPGGAALRIQGEARLPEVRAAAKAAGFEVRQVGSYVASATPGAVPLPQLRQALAKVAGVEQVDLRELAGGATLLIYGEAEERPLTAAAQNAGFVLRPLANAARPVEFKVAAAAGTELDEGKLRTVLTSIEGVREVAVRRADDGTRRVTLAGERVRPERILDAARAGGFELQAVEEVSLPSAIADAERNTPAAPDERILEDLAPLGGLAPDFTLLTSDGQGKVSLSQFRGQKPVALIFGSYT